MQHLGGRDLSYLLYLNDFKLVSQNYPAAIYVSMMLTAAWEAENSYKLSSESNHLLGIEYLVRALSE